MSRKQNLYTLVPNKPYIRFQVIVTLIFQPQRQNKKQEEALQKVGKLVEILHLPPMMVNRRIGQIFKGIQLK